MDEKPYLGPPAPPSESSPSTPASSGPPDHGGSSVASTPASQASTSSESSLEWLLRVSKEKNQNKPPPELSDTRPADATESLKEYLIRISLAFIHAMNRRDFDACYGMADSIDHSRFTAKLTDYLLVKSFRDHVDNCIYRCSYAPEVHFEISDVNAIVNENKGLAYIWVNIEARDQPGGIATQGVGQWEWRRVLTDGEEKWLCSKYSAVKGLPPEGLV